MSKRDSKGNVKTSNADYNMTNAVHSDNPNTENKNPSEPIHKHPKITNSKSYNPKDHYFIMEIPVHLDGSFQKKIAAGLIMLAHSARSKLTFTRSSNTSRIVVNLDTFEYESRLLILKLTANDFKSNRYKLQVPSDQIFFTRIIIDQKNIYYVGQVIFLLNAKEDQEYLKIQNQEIINMVPGRQDLGHQFLKYFYGRNKTDTSKMILILKFYFKTRADWEKCFKYGETRKLSIAGKDCDYSINGIMTKRIETVTWTLKDGDIKKKTLMDRSEFEIDLTNDSETEDEETTQNEQSQNNDVACDRELSEFKNSTYLK